jgi:hypothetical protein
MFAQKATGGTELVGSIDTFQNEQSGFMIRYPTDGYLKPRFGREISWLSKLTPFQSISR